MGQFLRHEDARWSTFRVFFYDLEFVGPPSDVGGCFVWEMAVVDWLTGESIRRVVRPRAPPDAFPDSHGPRRVTAEIIEGMDPMGFDRGFLETYAWMRTRAGGAAILLVSHNNFRTDHPLLRLELARSGLHRGQFPMFFFDTLPFFRSKLPAVDSYSLGNLYRAFMGGPLEGAHRALADAAALRALVCKIARSPAELHGAVYPLDQTSMQTLPAIGAKTEERLIGIGVQSREHLAHLSRDERRIGGILRDLGVGRDRALAILGALAHR